MIRFHLLKVTMNEKVLILLDSDVIIHLFKAEKISLLTELYPGRLRMLDVVLSELLKNRTMNKIVENLFLFKQVDEIAFPIELFNEQIKLKNKIKGEGESACLIYCKHNKHIIASSNTHDIVPFCEENAITYLTTLDIFTVAVDRQIITKKEANEFIKMILSKNSFLCCSSIEEHIKKHFKKDKLMY